jgi:hypothetical protein
MLTMTSLPCLMSFGRRRLLQSNTEYILMSGSAKLVAIAITYPYQVIRSRIQVSCVSSSLGSELALRRTVRK